MNILFICEIYNFMAEISVKASANLMYTNYLLFVYPPW